MTDNPKSHPQGNAEKNPEDWVTGDEPMTKAEASERIDALQEKSGRG